MSIGIQGKSPNLYQQDVNSIGGGFVTPYASNGNELFSYFPKRYILPVGLVGRQTGTPVADSTIWALRNLGSANMYIKRIRLMATFDGTAAATTARYYFTRGRTATPTGGTALTAVKADTAMANGQTYDAREAVAGLTMTSVTFDTAWDQVTCQRQVSATAPYEWVAQDIKDSIVLAVNDIFCIRLGVAGVIGDMLSGQIEWGEL